MQQQGPFFLRHTSPNTTLAAAPPRVPTKAHAQWAAAHNWPSVYDVTQQDNQRCKHACPSQLCAPPPCTSSPAPPPFPLPPPPRLALELHCPPRTQLPPHRCPCEAPRPPPLPLPASRQKRSHARHPHGRTCPHKLGQASYSCCIDRCGYQSRRQPLLGAVGLHQLPEQASMDGQGHKVAAYARGTPCDATPRGAL